MLSQTLIIVFLSGNNEYDTSALSSTKVKETAFEPSSLAFSK